MQKRKIKRSEFICSYVFVKCGKSIILSLSEHVSRHVEFSDDACPPSLLSRGKINAKKGRSWGSFSPSSSTLHAACTHTLLKHTHTHRNKYLTKITMREKERVVTIPSPLKPIHQAPLQPRSTRDMRRGQAVRIALGGGVCSYLASCTDLLCKTQNRKLCVCGILLY